MYFDQQEFYIRCEWGEHGVAQLAADSDALVIVDVLSFSTCVDIAVSRGAVVYPYQWKDETAETYAKSLNAVLAGSSRSTESYTLSPSSMIEIPSGTHVVLPSPNGSSLVTKCEGVHTFAGCLRNGAAIAKAVQTVGKRINIVPAGERWPDGSLRPALEDLIGAGSINRHLKGSLSPEAEQAVATHEHFKGDLLNCLNRCGSGKELR